jgi:hypothetical protein
MSYSKYLIVGCSHAGLSALDAIRIRDREGSVTMLTRVNLVRMKSIFGMREN